MKTHHHPSVLAFLNLLALSTLAAQLSTLAQSPAITYQGRLNDNGAPANGSYDLTFSLFDVSTGGNQVGFAATNLATSVTGGLFTVELTFGPNGTAGPFLSGAPFSIEIGAIT